MTISTLRPKAAREWKSSKNTSHLAPISVIEKSTPKLRPESAHELAGESAETPADSWMLAPSCRQAWQRPVKDKKKSANPRVFLAIVNLFKSQTIEPYFNGQHQIRPARHAGSLTGPWIRCGIPKCWGHLTPAHVGAYNVAMGLRPRVFPPRWRTRDVLDRVSTMQNAPRFHDC